MSPTHALPVPSNALRIAMRVGAAVLGGYAFAWGVVAAATSVLFAAGMEFHDAEFLGAVAGLLAYLAAFLWAVAARRLARAWLLLLAGGAALSAAASLMQSVLL